MTAQSKEDIEKIASDIEKCQACCQNAIDNITSLPLSYMTINDAIDMLERDRENLDELKEHISVIDAELRKYIDPSNRKIFFLSYLIPSVSKIYNATLELLKKQEARGSGGKKCVDVFYLRKNIDDEFIV